MTTAEIVGPERPQRPALPELVRVGAADTDAARSALNAASLHLARKARRLRALATQARAEDAPSRPLLDEIRSFETAANRARAAQDVLRSRNALRYALMRSPVRGVLLDATAVCVKRVEVAPDDDRHMIPVACAHTQAPTAAQREL
jgi:hypothetical protein